MSSQGRTVFPSSADLFYLLTTSSRSEEELNFHYAPPSRSSLKIGVLVLGHGQVQLLDLAPVDVLAKISRNELQKLGASTSILDEAVDEVDIRYVCEAGPGSFATTSATRMPVTNFLDDAPQFDILFMPGSFESAELSSTAKDFITTQCAHEDFLAIVTVASAAIYLAQTGLLDQKRAAAPSSQLASLRQRHPDVLWQEDLQWTRHDKIWSSHSAVSAIDMMAAWMREHFWDRIEAVECALVAMGVPPFDGEA